MIDQLHGRSALLFENAPHPPCSNWIEGFMVPRTGLDYVKKRKVSPLPGLEL
jgi:hypothetical protein